VLLPLPLPVWCGLCMRGRLRMLMMAPHPIVGLRPSQPGDAAEQREWNAGGVAWLAMLDFSTGGVGAMHVLPVHALWRLQILLPARAGTVIYVLAMAQFHFYFASD
jgi:hypothetical protein